MENAMVSPARLISRMWRPERERSHHLLLGSALSESPMLDPA
jgi:hypothetical protein